MLFDNGRATDPFLDASVAHPVVIHLNADNSWLLSLPYPSHLQPSVQGRCRYNIVIDPWLTGTQVDYHRYFSSQEHAQTSSIQSLVQLNELLEKAESAISRPQQADRELYYIDAVCCSHEFTDHCHRSTLEELPPSVTVFATGKAAALVRTWKYFERIVEIPMFTSGQERQLPMLPDWIQIGRVHSKGDGPVYLHSALVTSFQLRQDETPELIIHTPHGIEAQSLSTAIGGDARVLLLLHGLHDISLAGSQLNLGRSNALQISKILNVRYWSPTHDEVKIARGLVSYLLKRSAHTFGIAPGSHPITDEDESPEPKPKHTNFVMIGNGQTLVLE